MNLLPFTHKPLVSVAVDGIITLISVAAFTTLILLAAGAPLSAYYHIFLGAFGSWVKFGHVVKAWIPLTLCACGLLYTFKIGLWNIGIEGQMIMGAVFATAVLRLGAASENEIFYLWLSFPAGLIGGAIWAVIAGFLKTKCGVNEIFAGLGLNFVAQGFILWLIFGPWKQPGVASMSGTETFPPTLWLPQAFSINVPPVGIFLTILAICTTVFMLRYTRIGLNLKAIGNNAAASVLFGLHPDRYMLLAMIFAGGLAGLSGSIQVSAVYHRLIPSISSGYGYLALLVVMLAGFRTGIAAIVSLFFACLNVGSIQLPIVLQLDSSLSGVIQGSLVLATLGVHAWRRRQFAS
ncbi:MAG: ABC transporter permease [Deltaproteobacteria bacterium]|nr:ABC transporter permease [Deltaproteobacteria bacterium]